MERILLIKSDELNKYQRGERCEIYVITHDPDVKLEYIKLIIKTFIDMRNWNYEVIMANINSLERFEETSLSWFKGCEDYVRDRLFQIAF